MSFPAYPSYKDSGVEWLGQIPDHWQAKAIKRNYAVIGGSTPKSDVAEFWDGDISWVTPSDLSKLSGLDIEQAERNITNAGLNSCGTSMVPKGSVILSTRAPIGSLAIAAKSLCTNQGCKSLVPDGTQNSKFLAYALSVATTELNIRGKGTTFLELSGDELGSFKISMPDFSEQGSIVAFLDSETMKIDALISEQEELIALLSEKRKSVISNATTLGIKLNAQLTVTGDPWLPHVPSHWRFANFQRFVSIAEGQVNPEVEPYRSMTLVAPNHVQSGTGQLLAMETAADQLAESGKYLCRRGDVIYSKIRPALRKVVLAPEDCLCSADMYPMSGGAVLNNEFLALFMLSEAFSAFAVIESDRVAMPKINRESLKAIKLPIPPWNEQLEIVAFINAEVRKIDDLTSEAAVGIQLLRERRASIIVAAVTGKIDVRGLVASTVQ